MRLCPRSDLRRMRRSIRIASFPSRGSAIESRCNRRPILVTLVFSLDTCGLHYRTVWGQRSQHVAGPGVGPAWAVWTGPAFLDSGRRIGPATSELGVVLGRLRGREQRGSDPGFGLALRAQPGSLPLLLAWPIWLLHVGCLAAQPAANGRGTR